MPFGKYLLDVTGNKSSYEDPVTLLNPCALLIYQVTVWGSLIFIHRALWDSLVLLDIEVPCKSLAAPAGDTDGCRVEIIPFAIDLLPAHCHGTIWFI